MGTDPRQALCCAHYRQRVGTNRTVCERLPDTVGGTFSRKEGRPVKDEGRHEGTSCGA